MSQLQKSSRNARNPFINGDYEIKIQRSVDNVNTDPFKLENLQYKGRQKQKSL